MHTERGEQKYKSLKKNYHGVIRYDNNTNVGIAYDAWIGNPVSEYHPVFSPQNYLGLPQNSPKLTGLAIQFARGGTTLIKAQNIVLALQQNYSYALTLTDGELAKINSKNALNNFLFTTHKGTCEHFATAATLMMRAVGIPARLITGFSGAKWNSVGSYYYVSADMAHAWTEIYIDGHWLTIDATPSATSISERKNRSEFWSLFADTMAMHWHQYVMDFDETSRKHFWLAVASMFKYLKHFKMLFLLTGLLLIAVMIIYRVKNKFKNPSAFIQYFLNMFTPARQKNRQDYNSGRAIALYLKLEKVLHRKYTKRNPSTTPQTYINSLKLDVKSRQTAHRVLEYYHKARFGNISLNPTLYRDITAEILQLKQRLK